MLPNTISYNALISACAKSNQPKWSLELFEGMKQQREMPNVITYSALISSCEKNQ